MNLESISFTSCFPRFTVHTASLSFAGAIITGIGGILAHYQNVAPYWSYGLAGISTVFFALSVVSQVKRNKKTENLPMSQVLLADSSGYQALQPVDSNRLWKIYHASKKASSAELPDRLNAEGVTVHELTAVLRSFFSKDKTLLSELLQRCSSAQLLQILTQAKIPLEFRFEGKLFLQVFLETYPRAHKEILKLLSPGQYSAEEVLEILSWMLKKDFELVQAAEKVFEKLGTDPSFPQNDRTLLIQKAAGSWVRFNNLIRFLKACSIQPEELIQIDVGEAPLLKKIIFPDLIPAAKLLKQENLFTLEILKALLNDCRQSFDFKILLSLLDEKYLSPGTDTAAFVIREQLPNQEMYLESLNSKELNWIDPAGNTLLHIAASVGNLSAIQSLLEKKIPKHAKNAEGKTPYALAQESGHSDAAQRFLPSQALIKDMIEMTSDKELGVKLKYEEVTLELLTSGDPCLLEKLIISHVTAFPTILREAGLSLTFEWRGQPFLLSCINALSSYSIDAIEALLTDIQEIPSEQGGKLIIGFLKKSRVEAAEILMKKMPAIALPQTEDRTLKELIPKVMREWKDSKSILTFLIALDFNALHFRDSQGNTLLHHAAFIGNLEILQYLLDATVDPLLKNSKNESAEDVAKQRGHAQAAQRLLSAQNSMASLSPEERKAIQQLNFFSRKYLSEKKLSPLGSSSSSKEITKRYRAIMLKCHTDKGGSNEDTQALNVSMDVLKSNRS